MATGKQLAIKIVAKTQKKHGHSYADWQDSMERLYREVCIMKRVSQFHPHIVRLYEMIDTPNFLFLFFELCDNGELFEHICSGRLPEETARRYYQEIISGLAYCHSFRVAHRDLKPENLLINGRGNLKIGDFGLGNFEHQGSALTTCCGSPNYAAPEIISGYPYSGTEVDIWSSGIILYAMLCGYLPFDHPNRHVLFDMIKHANFKIPGFVSDGARNLLYRLIAVDPQQRMTLRGIRQDPWFLQKLPRYMKNNFPSRCVPVMRSLMRRKYYLHRFGIPEFSSEELKDQFSIDVSQSPVMESVRRWEIIADPVKTQMNPIAWDFEKHYNDQGDRDNEVVQHDDRGYRRYDVNEVQYNCDNNRSSSSFALNAQDNKMVDNKNSEVGLKKKNIPDVDVKDKNVVSSSGGSSLLPEYFRLLEPDSKPINSSIVQHLRELGYDIPNPVQNIKQELKSDISVSPETTAYHILNHEQFINESLMPNSRISIGQASLLGITHRHITCNGFPNLLTKRQKWIIAARRKINLHKETNGLVYQNGTDRGVYSYQHNEDQLSMKGKQL